MARPQKKGVDYFSHDVSHGKTIFVLEQRWGNDGYAVWFKLLEALAAAENHYLDLSDEATELYLSANCHVSVETLRDILGALGTLGAISTDLWRVSSVVWCQKLVDRLSDVYRLRKSDLPSKPDHFLVCPLETKVSTEETIVNPVVSTQSKLNKKKPKEPMTNTTKSARAKIADLYCQVFEKSVVSSIIWKKIDDLLQLYPPEKVTEAFETMAGTTGKTWNYLIGILEEKGGSNGKGNSRSAAEADAEKGGSRRPKSGKRSVSDIDTGTTGWADGF